MFSAQVATRGIKTNPFYVPAATGGDFIPPLSQQLLLMLIE